MSSSPADDPFHELRRYCIEQFGEIQAEAALELIARATELGFDAALAGAATRARLGVPHPLDTAALEAEHDRIWNSQLLPGLGFGPPSPAILRRLEYLESAIRAARAAQAAPAVSTPEAPPSTPEGRFRPTFIPAFLAADLEPEEVEADSRPPAMVSLADQSGDGFVALEEVEAETVDLPRPTLRERLQMIVDWLLTNGSTDFVAAVCAAVLILILVLFMGLHGSALWHLTAVLVYTGLFALAGFLAERRRGLERIAVGYETVAGIMLPLDFLAAQKYLRLDQLGISPTLMLAVAFVVSAFVYMFLALRRNLPVEEMRRPYAAATVAALLGWAIALPISLRIPQYVGVLLALTVPLMALLDYQANWSYSQPEWRAFSPVAWVAIRLVTIGVGAYTLLVLAAQAYDGLAGTSIARHSPHTLSMVSITTSTMAVAYAFYCALRRRPAEEAESEGVFLAWSDAWRHETWVVALFASLAILSVGNDLNLHPVIRQLGLLAVAAVLTLWAIDQVTDRRLRMGYRLGGIFMVLIGLALQAEDRKPDLRWIYYLASALYVVAVLVHTVGPQRVSARLRQQARAEAAARRSQTVPRDGEGALATGASDPPVTGSEAKPGPAGSW